jgi:hypothetical protein
MEKGGRRERERGRKRNRDRESDSVRDVCYTRINVSRDRGAVSHCQELTRSQPS